MALDAFMHLRPGTLNLFILRALVNGPEHGFGVVTGLRSLSGGELDIEEGAVYHALHRMERQGLLAAEWAPSDNSRTAKFYRLTPHGRRELRRETSDWTRYAAIMARALRPTR